MSRLVNFGLGEVCDRLSILALKILHGTQRAIDVKHFEHERAALVTKLLARESGKWIEAYAELAAVNAALWYAEDRMRAYRQQPAHSVEEVVETAFQIQALNDRRAELVRTINATVGDAVLEKV